MLWAEGRAGWIPMKQQAGSCGSVESLAHKLLCPLPAFPSLPESKWSRWFCINPLTTSPKPPPAPGQQQDSAPASRAWGPCPAPTDSPKAPRGAQGSLCPSQSCPHQAGGSLLFILPSELGLPWLGGVYAPEELTFLFLSASMPCWEKDLLLPSIINPSLPLCKAVQFSARISHDCCNKKDGSEWERRKLSMARCCAELVMSCLIVTFKYIWCLPKA